MVMGRLLVGSPPINDAGNVPVAVPTKVPCREVSLQGPFPADLLRGLCFSNSLASSAEWVSIWSFLSNRCSWEMFPFTFLPRGVNHSSPRGHQVDPRATESSSSAHPPRPFHRAFWRHGPLPGLDHDQ